MKAVSTAASTARHTLLAAFEALLIVAIVAALALGVALATGHAGWANSIFAASGGSGGRQGATISLIEPTNAAVTASWPSAGSKVSFHVTANVKSSDTYRLWVANQCFQDGAKVYAEFQPVLSGASGPFTLAWSGGGSAHCTSFVFLYPMTASPLSGGSMAYTAS
jgi:hypothetical protein